MFLTLTFPLTKFINLLLRTFMVHQLSLVSTVEHGYYVQTVATLKALTGLQSTQNIATYNLVTKPHDVFKPKVEAGKVNQIEQYYMKCITTWDEDTGDIEKPILKDSNTVEASRLFVGDNNKRIWTLQISDIPVAGKNQTCSAQTIYDSTLVHHHTKVVDKVEKENLDQFEFVRNDSFLQFLSDLGYDVINQFWLKGVRFFHGDIVIEIFKVFIRDDERQSSDNAIALKLLDESNTFQFKAYINVPKATDVDAINQGTKELLKYGQSCIEIGYYCLALTTKNGLFRNFPIVKFPISPFSADGFRELILSSICCKLSGSCCLWSPGKSLKWSLFVELLLATLSSSYKWLIKTICVSNAFFIFVVSSLEIVLWSPEIRSIFLTTASSIFGVSIPAGLCNRLVIDHDGLLSKSRIASFDRLLVIDIFEK